VDFPDAPDGRSFVVVFGDANRVGSVGVELSRESPGCVIGVLAVSLDSVVRELGPCRLSLSRWIGD